MATTPMVIANAAAVPIMPKTNGVNNSMTNGTMNNRIVFTKNKAEERSEGSAWISKK